MGTYRRLSFEAHPVTDGGTLAFVPMIDGVSLLDRVTAYETARGMSPAGGYGGLIPAQFRFGDLRTYFLGVQGDQWPSPGRAWLLACDCGEVGCWPLTARIGLLGDTVMWFGFGQDHRPQWDYSSFGPFEFERSQYERAVGWVAEQAEADEARTRDA